MSTRVTVVGRGVIGLTTALVLATHGFQVRCIGMDSRSPSSWSACALTLPYFGVHPSDELAKWSAIGFDAFELLERRPGTGVSRLTMVECFRTEVRPPATLTASRLVSAQRRQDLPAPYEFAWEFETFLVEMTRYLTFLERECVDASVEFAVEEWRPEIGLRDTDFIVNCAGHWASQIDGSLAITPVRGQIIVLADVKPRLAVGGDEYLIAPRSDGCVVGSLWQVGQTDADPSEDDTAALLEVFRSWRSAGLLSLSDDATPAVSGVMAGVRPFREQGPLVRMDMHTPTPVIHNVGHGGSGVALSWGCADQVVNLLAPIV